jgi:hypothetical protein
MSRYTEPERGILSGETDDEPCLSVDACTVLTLMAASAQSDRCHQPTRCS